MKTKLNRNKFKGDFRKKLKNLKTFESMNNESATQFYNGDFDKAKDFYKSVIVPACGSSVNPMSVIDVLVNDEYSDDEDLVQYLHDEFGIPYEDGKEIVGGRNMFVAQMFNPEELNEAAGVEGRVPNEGKTKLQGKIKAKLNELRGMSDNELLAFLNNNLQPNALKKFMK